MATFRLRARVLTPIGLALSIGLAISLLLFRSAHAGGGVVGDCSSDADLIAKLGGGGSITFSCGPATIVLSSQQIITQVTSINGGGVITLSGGGVTRTFWVISGTQLNLANIRLYNSHAISDGGAILNQGTLFVTNSQFISNSISVGLGGAISNTGTLHVINSQFQRNRAGQGGGIHNLGQAFITNTTFFSNIAVLYGAGLENFGLATVLNSTFYSNTAYECCVGIENEGQLTMMGGSIHHNQAITTTGYTYAGGIGTYTGQATLIDVDIHHNLVAGSSGDAGGMEVGGPTVLNGVRLFANTVLTAHNTYGGGGGLNFYDGWLEMINSSVFANQVISGTGGGIEVEPGKTLTVTNSAIYNNSASTNGGGIFARGTLSIISSTVWGNQAKLGGGIYAIGRLAITGTRFISNSAIGNGLEVLVDGGPTRIVNSIFRSNGAGVESVFVSTTLTSSNQILFSTFAALSGINANVGLYVRKGAVGITNSIFSSLTHGIYNNGGLAYEDYNLFWNDTFTTTSTVGGSNDASGDPRFANFALDDFHLLLGSAAINAGTDAGVMIDSDGLPRPSGGGFDIGAYEYEVIRKVYLPIVLKNF